MQKKKKRKEIIHLLPRRSKIHIHTTLQDLAGLYDWGNKKCRGCRSEKKIHNMVVSRETRLGEKGEQKEVTGMQLASKKHEIVGTC